jgi:hypothetical protein
MTRVGSQRHSKKVIKKHGQKNVNNQVRHLKNNLFIGCHKQQGMFPSGLHHIQL